MVARPALSAYLKIHTVEAKPTPLNPHPHWPAGTISEATALPRVEIVHANLKLAGRGDAIPGLQDVLFRPVAMRVEINKSRCNHVA